MKNQEYKIGDWVFCNKSVTFTYEEVPSNEFPLGKDGKHIGNRIIKYSRVMFLGQICGATYKSTGKLIRNIYKNVNGSIGYGRPALKVDKTYLVYKVARGMTNIPVLVLPKDISVKFNSHRSSIKLPFRFYEKLPHLIAANRDKAKSQKRDKKGHFIKGYK